MENEKHAYETGEVFVGIRVFRSLRCLVELVERFFVLGPWKLAGSSGRRLGRFRVRAFQGQQQLASGDAVLLGGIYKHVDALATTEVAHPARLHQLRN